MFFERVKIADKSETCELFKLYDIIVTQRSTLSAMLKSAKEIGTHGSAMIDRIGGNGDNTPRRTKTVTRGTVSEIVAVSEMPNPELWFETLLNRRREENL